MRIYHWKRTTTPVIFVSLLTVGVTLRWIAVRDNEIERNASVDTLKSEMTSITEVRHPPSYNLMEEKYGHDWRDDADRFLFKRNLHIR